MPRGLFWRKGWSTCLGNDRRVALRARRDPLQTRWMTAADPRQIRRKICKRGLPMAPPAGSLARRVHREIKQSRENQLSSAEPSAVRSQRGPMSRECVDFVRRAEIWRG
jgi:hypothetical protein